MRGCFSAVFSVRKYTFKLTKLCDPAGIVQQLHSQQALNETEILVAEFYTFE